MSPVELVISEMPKDVQWKHHGRSPEEGLDCAGLVLWILYQLYVDTSSLDLPYEPDDLKNPELRERTISILESRTVDVTKDWLCSQRKDGDVVTYIHLKGSCLHLGIYASDKIYEMDDRLRIRDAKRLMPFIHRVFRFEEIK